MLLSKRSYYVEKLYPSTLAICTLILLIWQGKFVMTNFSNEIFNAIFTVFAIFCGFLSTSITIFCSTRNKENYKLMQNAKLDKRIIDYHFSAMFWCLAVIGVAFVSQFFVETNFITYLYCLVLALTVGAFLAFIRATIAIMATIKYLLNIPPYGRTKTIKPMYNFKAND